MSDVSVVLAILWTFNESASYNAMCEVNRLDYALLLTDRVNVTYQVRTTAYRIYRTPVQYMKHHLCILSTTPSSNS